MMNMDAQCMLCHFRRNVEAARSMGDEETATKFARALTELYRDAPPEDCTPMIGPATADLFDRFYGVGKDRYWQEKQQSNRFVMERMEQIQVIPQAQPDPVLAGLQLAVLGNYIDFSALQGEVSFAKLDALLQEAMDIELDMTVYERMRADFQKGRKVLYLTDNAGEIGFDRVFAQELQKAYPHLEITFCVKGGPALNDAMREDAEAVGLPFPVIDNGNRVPGTVIKKLSPEAKQALDEADVIISKGQANVETLLGCGYNIYYAFLIKCDRFVKLFHKPKLAPMLLAEQKGANQ